MKIKKALKEKNRLVKEISQELKIASDYNSIEAGNPRRFSSRTALENASKLIKELVELKAKIHRANVEVYEKIFHISELKNLVKHIKSIPVQEGKVYTDRFNSQLSTREVEVTATDQHEMIRSFEAEIDAYQEELDLHNATTEI